MVFLVLFPSWNPFSSQRVITKIQPNCFIFLSKTQQLLRVNAIKLKIFHTTELTIRPLPNFLLSHLLSLLNFLSISLELLVFHQTCFFTSLVPFLKSFLASAYVTLFTWMPTLFSKLVNAIIPSYSPFYGRRLPLQEAFPSLYWAHFLVIPNNIIEFLSYSKSMLWLSAHIFALIVLASEGRACGPVCYT